MKWEREDPLCGGQSLPQFGSQMLCSFVPIGLGRNSAPYWPGPGNICLKTGNDMHMKLGYLIAERPDIEFLAVRNTLQRFAGCGDFVHKQVLVGRAKVDQLYEIILPWHEEKPRVIGIFHQPNGTQREVCNEQAVAFQASVELKSGHEISQKQGTGRYTALWPIGQFVMVTLGISLKPAKKLEFPSCQNPPLF